MNEKVLYIQRLKAQLYDWQADIDKIKSKMAGASIGAKLEINQHINNLEGKIGEGKIKIEQLCEANDDTWDTTKAEVEGIWEAISSSYKEAYENLLY